MIGRPFGRTLLVSLIILAASAPLVGATAGPTWKPTAAGDLMVGVALPAHVVNLGFVDLDRDGRSDADAPDEPVYIDADNDFYVSTGDIRLSPYLDYASGLAVDFANRDHGRSLVVITPWFATDPLGDWYVDTDATSTVTPGDVALTGPAAGSKLAPADPAGGSPLAYAQDSVPQNRRVLWDDVDANQRRDIGERLYLDLDGNGRIDLGEPGINDRGPATDDVPSRNQFEAALAAQRAWNVALLTIGLLALAGAAGIGAYLYRERHRPKDHEAEPSHERPSRID